MKKTISVAIAVILFALSALLSGCALLDPAGKTESNPPSSSQKTSSDTEPTEAVIRALVDENLICMKEIFALSSLPTQGAALMDNIYQVDQTKFADYAAFEAYVSSVYCKAESELLLKDYPTEGAPKYLNMDGRLCIDMDKDGAKGYYVDWTGYSLKIDSTTDDECKFTVTTTIEEPSDNPVKEAHPVSGVAVLEDGKWLLKSMIY